MGWKTSRETSIIFLPIKTLINFYNIKYIRGDIVLQEEQRVNIIRVLDEAVKAIKDGNIVLLKDLKQPDNT